MGEPFTPFINIFSNPKLKLGIADKMMSNDRYRAVLEQLQFPVIRTPA